MRAITRPARAVMTLSAAALVGLGLAAYLVNIPLLWIGIGELAGIAGIAWRASKIKPPHPFSENDGPGPSDSRPTTPDKTSE